MIPSALQGNVLRIARVVEFHPEENSADLVFLDDGSRAVGVQIMSAFAGSDTGTMYLPQPDRHEADEDRWSPKLTGKRDVLAVVAHLRVMPVVLGFMPPQVTQLAFDHSEHPNMLLERHASDFERVVRDDGSMTLRHPNGTHITIGSVPDLEGKDFDRIYQRSRNKDASLPITVEVAAGGEVRARITMTPSGNVSVWAEKQVAIEAGEHILIQAPRVDINP